MFASVGVAYILWFFFGIFGAHVSGGRPHLMTPALVVTDPLSRHCCWPFTLCPRALQRFYVGRPISGLVWLFTLGLFGVGWIIDVFLIPAFVEDNNKRVFHQQMLETGNSLLFDGEYGVSTSFAAALSWRVVMAAPPHSHAPLVRCRGRLVPAAMRTTLPHQAVPLRGRLPRTRSTFTFRSLLRVPSRPATGRTINTAAFLGVAFGLPWVPPAMVCVHRQSIAKSCPT